MNPARGLARARKALRRSPRYIAVRIGRELARYGRRPWDRFRPSTLTERALLRATGAASIDDLWTARLAAPFFMNARRRDVWVECFRRAFPDAVAPTVAAAKSTLRHEFDLLGSGPMPLGRVLPWHVDFKSGRQWPVHWCHAYDPNELDRPSDIKVPWELSRCQHFTALGQAYWLTEDECFADEFAAQVTHWIESNPYTLGLNWACPMDVALRAISWIWGFHFFAGAPACRAPNFRSRLLRTLFLHGEFIAANLENDDVNGNHYLMDGVGLVVLGLFFGAASAATRWLDTGRRIVVDGILNQTWEDGPSIEQSTAYHRLVLEGFLTVGLLLKMRNETPSRHFWTRLERMFDFVSAYTGPTGEASLIGDADDGRVQKLGLQPVGDHRYLLSTGAVLFGRPAFKHTAGRFWEESFWLLGPNGLQAFDEIGPPAGQAQLAAFPRSGFYVLRHESAHVVMDCGEVGLKGLGGHGHNDVLSFELSLARQRLFTDSGTFLYTASREWRNAFRSTAFHNTVQVDGEELNRLVRPDELWRLRYDAVPTGVRWRVGADRHSVRAGHRGYERLTPPVTHVRGWWLHREEACLVVADRLGGQGRHHLVWRFHLDPAVEATVEPSGVRLEVAGRCFWLTPIAGPVDLVIRLDSGWVSPRYGVKLARTVIVAETRQRLPVECVWAVSERKADASDLARYLMVAEEDA